MVLSRAAVWIDNFNLKATDKIRGNPPVHAIAWRTIYLRRVADLNYLLERLMRET